MNDNSNLQNKDEKTFDQNVSDLANLYSTNIPVQPKQTPQKSVNNTDNTSSVIPEKNVSVPSPENSVSNVSSQNKEVSSDTTNNFHVTYAPRLGTTMIGDVNPALLEAFIGPNYYKFMNSSFSFSAFFLGNLYFFYRKLYIPAIIYLISFKILLALITNPFLSFVISLGFMFVVGISFYSFYRTYAINKIHAIEKTYTNFEEQKKACVQQGGTSGISILIGIGVSLGISILFSLVFSFTHDNSSLLNILPNSQDSPYTTTSEVKTSDSNSSTYPDSKLYLLSEAKPTVFLKDRLSVQLPSSYHNVSDYDYYYQYVGQNEDPYYCLYVEKSFDDEDSYLYSLLSMMAYIDELSLDTKPTSVSSNGANWTYITYHALNHYYILAMIEKDGYVYNFRGEDVGNEWNQEFINTYNQIFQSIQFK